MYIIRLEEEGFYAERGGITLRGFFWILLLGLVLYVAYLVVPPYIDYRMLSIEVAAEARTAHRYDDGEIRNRILEKARYWEVPVEAGNIEITRGSDDIEISVEYGVPVRFFTYEKTFFYRIYLKEPLRKT